MEKNTLLCRAMVRKRAGEKHTFGRTLVQLRAQIESDTFF